MTIADISKGLPTMLKNAHKMSDDERLGNGDASYGSEMLMWLIKQLYEHPEDDPSSVLKNFTANGIDEAQLAKMLMEEGIDEPVTVTQTTTSVGGLDTDTPEEVGLEAKAEGLDDEDALYDAILRGDFDDMIDSEEAPAEEPEVTAEESEEAPEEASSTSEAEVPADFSDTDKTSAEEAADKPSEKKEEKPAEKKEEKPKEEKPKDKKDEPDDTMKNITSALSDRF